MDHSIPREAGVVDDDVDLAVAEGGGFFHELRDVGGVEHVARDGEGAAAGGGYRSRDRIGFF